MTDARLFMCEAQEGRVGRWDASGGKCAGVCCGWVGVARRERPHLSKCADMRVNAFAYTGICARTCLYLGEFDSAESQNETCALQLPHPKKKYRPRTAARQMGQRRRRSGRRANDELMVAKEAAVGAHSLFGIMTQSRRLRVLR